VDAARLPRRSIEVKQDVRRQTASLRGLSDPPGPAMAAMIDAASLRGALSVEVAGLSRPVTLCAPASDLDPEPCLLPGDIAMNSPLAWRDRDGGVHLIEQISAHQVVELARGGTALSLPVAIAGRTLTTLDWPLRFARPHDLVLASSTDGGDGPSLSVQIEARADRLIYTVDDGGRVLLAVAERSAARAFRIVSRGGSGGAGSDGFSGSDGSDGTTGSSASCPSWSGGSGGDGSDGSRGGDGGSGGNGGDGGDIEVTVRCEDGACSDLVAQLRDAIRSEGGPGGPGGRGGRGGHGGRGGSGGSGTSCTDDKGNTTSLSGGSDGRSGSDGSNGSDGSSGSDGKAGQVQFRTTRLSAQ
jgi:hypothetical protein